MRPALFPGDQTHKILSDGKIQARSGEARSARACLRRLVSVLLSPVSPREERGREGRRRYTRGALQPLAAVAAAPRSAVTRPRLPVAALFFSFLRADVAVAAFTLSFATTRLRTSADDSTADRHTRTRVASTSLTAPSLCLYGCADDAGLKGTRGKRVSSRLCQRTRTRAGRACVVACLGGHYDRLAAARVRRQRAMGEGGGGGPARFAEPACAPRCRGRKASQRESRREKKNSGERGVRTGSLTRR